MSIVLGAFTHILYNNPHRRPSSFGATEAERYRQTKNALNLSCTNYGALRHRRRYSNNVQLKPSTSQNALYGETALRNSNSEHDFLNATEQKRARKAHGRDRIRTIRPHSSGSVGQRANSAGNRKGICTERINPGFVDDQDLTDNLLDSGYRKRSHSTNVKQTTNKQLNVNSPNLITKSEEAIEIHSSSMQTIVLGFIRCTEKNLFNEFSPYDSFQRKDENLDRALAECNIIKNRADLVHEALLLKCMDTMYPFLHYVICKKDSKAMNSNNLSPSSNSPSKQHHKQQQSYGSFNKASDVNTLIDELNFENINKTEFGFYEELFDVDKTLRSNEPRLASSRHSGYIVTCFKLLEENYKQQSLEKSWLSWTGAREIYKYSPRTWNLRKITNGTVRNFAYVLICEFGNILHPANTLQALDMCERLRARNCGHISLYRVQYSYSPMHVNAALSNASAIHRPPYLTQNSCNSAQQSTSVSPKHSPKQPLPQQLSPWNSPKLLQQATTAAARRRELLRGYSHDVESAHETSRRRGAMLRMRDRSLGYYEDDTENGMDTGFNSSSGFQLSPMGSTMASAATVEILTPPRCSTPTNLLASMRLNPPHTTNIIHQSHNRFQQPLNYSQQFQELV